VLEEIGAADVPQILVYNKCDLLEDSRQPRQPSDWIEAHPGLRRQRVFVSAITGQGLEALRGAIAEHALARLNAADGPPSVLLPDGTLAAAPLPGAEPAAAFPPHQHA
jgi:GTPase